MMNRLEILKKDIIAELKNCFLALIGTKVDPLRCEIFTNDSLLIILRALQVESVALYMIHDGKQQFDKEGEAFANGKQSQGPSFISVKKYEDIMLNNEVFCKPFQSLGFEHYDSLLFLRTGNKLLGFIAIMDQTNLVLEQMKTNHLKAIADEYALLLEKSKELLRMATEESKYKRLFKATEQFHSSMNMDALLGEIIVTLQEVYPAFSYYLLLSNDNHSHNGLPIKDLEYDSENTTALQAYATGAIQFEESAVWDRSVIYAPIKGKQGVYGVLQVIAPDTPVFPKDEVEFITLLAHTAGSALENTQLYQQSKKLVSDLQLINETSHCLNSNLRLAETISYMSEQITQSFDAQEVGFILQPPNQEKVDILPGSSMFFFSNQGKLYIDYIMVRLEEENDALFIGDVNIPGDSDVLQYRSIMAIPMEQNADLKGFAIVLHKEPYFFPFESFKLLQSLIHHSALAFTNSMLREKLENMIITDHLTKLHSRNYFDEVIQDSMRKDKQGTFILIDIDNFKIINDTFGHQVGDEVLIQVSNLIRDNIRESDIGARWGGEEFAIYLPKVPVRMGIGIAERLVEKAAECSEPRITISCGVSYWKEERIDTYKYLFKRADEALYLAKDTGKNKVVTQNDCMRVS